MKCVSKLPSDTEPVHNSDWSQVQWFMMMVSICRLYFDLQLSLVWLSAVYPFIKISNLRYGHE